MHGNLFGVAALVSCYIRSIFVVLLLQVK